MDQDLCEHLYVRHVVDSKKTGREHRPEKPYKVAGYGFKRAIAPAPSTVTNTSLIAFRNGSVAGWC